MVKWINHSPCKPDLEVIKLEYSLKLKIKHNDWLLADTCPQSLRFILSLRMNSSFINSRPGGVGLTPGFTSLSDETLRCGPISI